MSDNNKNEIEKTNGKKQSAGQVLPDDKKHLKDKMPESVKSPMTELKDKSDVASES